MSLPTQLLLPVPLTAMSIMIIIIIIIINYRNNNNIKKHTIN